MVRAIRRFLSRLTGKTKVLFFMGIVLICIIALCIGIYTQFFYKYSETDPLMIGINIGSQKTAEELAALEASFNNVFENKIKVNSENVNVEKLEETKSLVYSAYKLKNEDENYYSVNAEIPLINIDSDKAKEINQEIRSEFYDKANNIMRQNKEFTVYNVTYQAYVNDDVLSLVIKASLKEGGKPEKVSIKTYNYNIPGESILSLQKIIDLKETTASAVQSKINEEIKMSATNAKILAADYENVYLRDENNSMYKVENASNFFLTDDGYVYIIYAYGNNEYTNEMDIVIF